MVTKALMGNVDLELLSVVRVVQLLRQPEDYDGWKVNKRAPQIGDTGTVLEILQAPGLPTAYVVECLRPDEDTWDTLWLGFFLAEELESVS